MLGTGTPGAVEAGADALDGTGDITPTIVTSAPAVKARVVEVATALFATDSTVQVTYGVGSPGNARDIIAVGDVSTTVGRPTLGARPRSRAETHQVTLVAMAGRQGPDRQRAATERAYALIDALSEYFRANPAESFGVSARADSWVTSYDLDEGDDDQKARIKGRFATVTAVLTVDIRI